MKNFDWKLFDGWCEVLSTSGKCCIEGLTFTKEVLYRFAHHYDWVKDEDGCPLPTNARVIVYNGDRCVSMSPTAFDKVFNAKYMNMMYDSPLF